MTSSQFLAFAGESHGPGVKKALRVLQCLPRPERRTVLAVLDIPWEDRLQTMAILDVAHSEFKELGVASSHAETVLNPWLESPNGRTSRPTSDFFQQEVTHET